MKSNQILNFFSIILVFLITSETHASSLKASGSVGANKYTDFGLIGRWSLSASPKPKSTIKKTDDDEEGIVTPEVKSKIVTSVQSTKSSGETTNEYKLGYESNLSEVTSYDISGYYRTEPSNVSVIGIQPSLGFDYEGLLLKDLSTSFSLGLDLSRSSTQTQVTALKKITESFSTVGISLNVSQEILLGLRASLGAAFYRYSETKSAVPASAKKLVNLVASASSLSTSGNPEKTFSAGLSWDWLEKWSSSYSISSTKPHFSGGTSIYSGLSIDHTFSKKWSAGLGYSWSNSGSSTGSLDVTYTW